MTTAYVVTSGEYSDYHIDAIFSTRELADSFIRRFLEQSKEGTYSRRFSDDEFHVGEWEMDGYSQLFGGWEVCIDCAGVVDYARFSPDQNTSEPARIIRQPSHLGGGISGFVGYGETREHARRSAEELRRATITGSVV